MVIPTEQRRLVLGLLRSSLQGRRREVGELVAWSVLDALPVFLFGRLVAEAIDEGFLAGSTGTGLAWLGLLAVTLVLAALATRQIYLRLPALVEPFRDELVRLVVAGALRRSTDLRARADSASVARLTEQVEIAREAYGSGLLVVQGFVVSSVGALLGLLTLEPIALLFVVPPFVISLALFFSALSRMAAKQRAMIIADEQISESASVLADGIRDVIACGGEQQIQRSVGESVEARARATRELARFTAARSVVVGVGGLAPLALLLIAAPWLVRQGMSTGTLVGAVTYVLQGVYPALQTLVRGLSDTGMWLFVALTRIVETTGAREGVEPAAPASERVPRSHDLVLEGVTFAYGEHAEPVIDGLDLTIPEGEYLAIAGPSGVGKSTLAGLMCGLLSPQHGEIRLGGVPLAEVDPATLPEHRVLIPQQAYVFSGTLLENLVYLRPDASPAAINHAVGQLGMRSFVDRLGGYAAELEPHSLSAGERQLVTLLRAYLSPAPIVVLDEATCHLDPTAEAIVERTFARRPGTLIVIAHRISSALRAHRVLVLDGTDIWLGTHADLLECSPLYRDLVGRWDPGAPPRAPAVS